MQGKNVLITVKQQRVSQHGMMCPEEIDLIGPRPPMIILIFYLVMPACPTITEHSRNVHRQVAAIKWQVTEKKLCQETLLLQVAYPCCHYV